jgi:hypothetical protein
MQRKIPAGAGIFLSRGFFDNDIEEKRLSARGRLTANAVSGASSLLLSFSFP